MSGEGHSKTLKNVRVLKDTRRTRRVHRDIYNEMSIVNKIAEIPNYVSYFILMEQQQIHERRASLVQIRTLHGGQRMSEYIIDIDRLLTNWITIQIHLAEGLRILHSRRLVYGDFSFDNIVIDDKNIPLMIDFGALKEKGDFNPDSDISAPEIDYFNGVGSLDGHSVMKDIYKRKQILHEIEEVFPSRESILSELLNFSDRYDESFIQKYVSASDMWSFGCEFYKLYMMLLSIPTIISSGFYTKYHNAQMHMLRGLLHVDPRKRLTADELLIELYTLKMS